MTYFPNIFLLWVQNDTLFVGACLGFFLKVSVLTAFRAGAGECAEVRDDSSLSAEVRVEGSSLSAEDLKELLIVWEV